MSIRTRWENFERLKRSPGYGAGYWIGFALGASGVIVWLLFAICIVAFLKGGG